MAEKGSGGTKDSTLPPVGTLAEREVRERYEELTCIERGIGAGWWTLVDLCCDPTTDTLLHIRTEGDQTFVVDVSSIRSMVAEVRAARRLLAACGLTDWPSEGRLARSVVTLNITPKEVVRHHLRLAKHLVRSAQRQRIMRQTSDTHVGPPPVVKPIKDES